MSTPTTVIEEPTPILEEVVPENPLGTRVLPAIRRFASDNGPLFGLIVLAIILAIASPVFLTQQNLFNVGVQASTIAIMALGMTFVIVAGGIDLSVGSVAALAAMVSSLAFSSAGLPGILSVLVGLLIGAITGAVSGFGIAYGRLPAFIATLAMLSVARGLTLVISDGRPVPTAGEVNFMGSTVGGFPVPIAVVAIAALIAAAILNRTVIGREMYAVGGNVDAARLSGIRVRRVLVTVFTLSGAYAGLAGMLLAGRLNTAQPQLASGFELDAIAAVVIGGASLSGGVGRVTGTIVGALILAIIRNGLNLLNVSSFWQQVVIGLVIAIAVLIDVLRRKNTRH